MGGQAVELDAVEEEAWAEERAGGLVAAVGDGKAKDGLLVDGSRRDIVVGASAGFPVGQGREPVDGNGARGGVVDPAAGIHQICEQVGAGEVGDRLVEGEAGAVGGWGWLGGNGGWEDQQKQAGDADPEKERMVYKTLVHSL